MSKGQELMDKGEKTLKKWFSWGSNKHEEAAGHFQKAGNQFKIAKEWKSAGAAFMRASDCHIHAGDSHEGTEQLIEAGRCYRKVKDKDAEMCFKAAIDMQCDEGKFTQAARLQKELADAYSEQERFDKAVEALLKAADFYNGEEQTTTANTTLLAAAKIYAEELNMPDAALKSFEAVADSYASHSSMKHNMKSVLLQCMMCRFIMVTPANKDVELQHCKDALARYEDKDINLSNTRELELMEGAISAALDDDPAGVAAAASNYNSIKRLDDWQVNCLNSLRKAVEDEDMC
eukprot:TRINITY_DN30307_c0_g1_i1.p1 TRINITY_DN30307_c0_g1~~TRINITY_DN30307_c0_g1_i1.p1  ORF type:complete len:290 (+),score=154.90 TRINITY_DN30307_c0_g1_i1:49-918(+)